MDKLDRLGWADGISFRSHGVHIGIRVNDSGVTGRIRDIVPHDAVIDSAPTVDHLFSVFMGSRARRGVRNFHQLYAESEQLARTLDPECILDTLESYLDLLIASEAPHDIFLHAGAVAWGGRAIIIPGPSMSGKSMLVAALLQAGATYYSDDYAVLDENGMVHPFPRLLSIRQADGSRSKAEPAKFGAPVGRQPAPVSLVVDVEYQPGASWRARPLTPGRALLTLLKSTIPAHTRAQAALPVLRDVVLHAPAIKAQRGEAEQTASRLLQYLNGNSSIT